MPSLAPRVTSQKTGGIDREVFLAFCARLLIPAKEGDQSGSGQTLVPLIPMKTQLYVLDEILEGLSRGVHFFTVLKCRQSGITTIGLAFDLYWCFKHDGVIFNFIADNSKRTAYNRSLIRDFVKSLKDYPEWRQPIEDDNRDLISFANRSKIIWNTANSRDEGGLGRGTGVVGCHGTEVGLWKDEEGVGSLLASLAQRNPNRFYLFEGTAKGPTIFRDMCEEAGRDGNTSQKFIFVGWWLHPDYDLNLKDKSHLAVYNTYWLTSPKPNHEESVWLEGIKVQYGYEVTPTQLAWWRWKVREEKFDNLDLMYQEYPPLPKYAWRYGGRNFIDGTKLMEKRIIAEQMRVAPRRFTFSFGDTFEDVRVAEVSENTGWCDLLSWEEPAKGEGVRYVIGVDPAHGADEEGDNASIQVYRCYSDKAVQVAEFVRNEIPTYQLAWVVLHLAGVYNSETILNVELQGGGFSVMEEIKRLQGETARGYHSALSDYFSGLKHYLYSRPDAVRPSHGAFHWRTTPDNRVRMLEDFRDFFQRGLLEIRSLDLIAEAESIDRLRSGELETGKENHRLMAACIALMAYKQCLETDIGGTKYTEAHFAAVNRADAGEIKPQEILDNMVLEWKDRVILADQVAREAKVKPKWMR